MTCCGFRDSVFVLLLTNKEIDLKKFTLFDR